MSQEHRMVFDAVSVRFPGAPNDGWVIQDISFTLEPGEFVAVIGPSGCGKTTLLKLAAGLMKPTGGQVLLNDRPVDGPGADRAVMFQEYGVFPWLTVRQNLAFGLSLKANLKPKKAVDAIVDTYLEIMGLKDFQHALPNTLSGGMRQRVALARTYAVNPRFLLMDEPFGALDAQTRLVMHDLLLELQQRERKNVFLITHSIDEALYLATRILLVTHRPARIAEVIHLPFDYPRDERLRATPAFVELQTHLRDRVMQEYAQQQNELSH